MRDTEKRDGDSYWKRPWRKWLILAAGILQLVCLWMNIREYQEYHRISAAGILSDFDWSGYAARKNLQCASNGLAAACFLGTFIIGGLVENKKTARLAEGLLLLFIALGWGSAGAALRLCSSGWSRFFWAVILILALGGAAYDLWKYRNMA